ncbi:MAG: hypothetical protein QOF18_1096 [Frankiaceae bacterium]|nr:hypothetical protein [Frankiaceae bacterium]
MDDQLTRWDYFLLERHLDRMTAIVAGLGDERANVTPELTGANSAYQILLHCCGMLEWWTRSAVLGREVRRDRDAEFGSSGSVADLLVRVANVRAQLLSDLELIDLDAPLAGDPSDHYVGTPIGASARGVLLHVLEELAQHHGHLEITRDLVTARHP